MALAHKTITSIALDQCGDMLQIRYGNKVKMLWSRTPKEEVTAVMAEIASVSKDTLARLQADFADKDLYMCLGALDIAAWEEEAAGGPEVPVALRSKARRLCEALGVHYASDAWRAAFIAAQRCRRRLAREAGAATEAGSTEVDNRRVWFEVLRRSGPVGEHAWLAPVLAFYASLLDGTGDVERGLGRHASFLSHHQGAPTGSDMSATEICLEIAVEGPQQDEEVAAQSKEHGTLLFTPFSRACAQKWLKAHGRRFTLKAVRKDAGKCRTGWRLQGSLLAVKRGQHSAADALVKQARADGGGAAYTAARPTVVGICRAQLARRAARLGAPVASKLLLSFRKRTADNLEAKRAAGGVWRGHGAKPPKLRRKPGAIPDNRVASLVGAPPSRAADAIVRQSKWIRRRKALAPPRGFPDKAKTKVNGPSAEKRGLCRDPPVVVALENDAAARKRSTPDLRGGSLAGQPPPKYRRLDASSLRHAKCIVVHSDKDLDNSKGTPDSDMLATWLNIVGYGRAVRAMDEPPKKKNTLTKYEASSETCPMDITTMPAFAEKHPRLASHLKALTRHPKSVWKDASLKQASPSAKPGKRAHHVVSDLESLRKMLLAARRLPAIAGVDSKYKILPKNVSFSRYGRAVRQH